MKSSKRFFAANPRQFQNPGQKPAHPIDLNCGMELHPGSLRILLERTSNLRARLPS
jgi:hypothetical protein